MGAGTQGTEEPYNGSSLTCRRIYKGSGFGGVGVEGLRVPGFGFFRG